jgi:hypothetical protein
LFTSLDWLRDALLREKDFAMRLDGPAEAVS